MILALGVLPSAGAQAVSQARTADLGSAGPGQDIGKAGQLTGSATGSLASSTSDDWWVVYPAAPGDSVTVTVKNTAPSSACDTLTATLDASNGSDTPVAGVTLNRADSDVLSGSSVGSDRYFVEVRSASCQPPQGEPVTYSLTLGSGGGGAAPEPAAGSIGAGTSLGTARSPLQGKTSYAGTVTSGSSDDWYVLYKKPDGSSATVRVEDTTIAGTTTCATLSVSLDAADGSDDPVVAATLADNAAATFAVTGRSATDTSGLYYLEIKSPGCPSGGISYRIEPENGAEWLNPARLPAAGAPPGSSIGDAWPPLKGGTTYDGTISSDADENWYVLFKKAGTMPATVRIEDTTVAGSTSCSELTVSLDSADGRDHVVAGATLGDNDAFTLPLPTSGTPDYLGRYLLEVRSDGCPSGGATYRIEPEPAGGWTTPAKPGSASLPAGRDRKAAGGPLMGGVGYQAALSNASSQDWVFLEATGKTPLTVSVQNTTPNPDNCQEESVSLLDSDGTVSGATLGDDDGAELIADSPRTYYLEISVTGACPPDTPLTATVTLTPTQAACSCGCRAPSAASPAAAAGATIDLEKPGGGTMPVSGKTTTVGVGEPIDLSLSCGPGATLTGPYKWELPAGAGYPVTLSSYDINDSGTSASTALAKLTKFTNPTFSLYLLKAGTYQVKATATVSGVRRTLMASFDVKAPASELTASTCKAGLNTLWTYDLPIGKAAPDRLTLGFNNQCVTTPGLTWSAKATLNDKVLPEGDVAVVQLINGTVRHSSQPKACLTTNGGQEADGAAFYPTSTSKPTIKGHTVSGFASGPAMETVMPGATKTLSSFDAPSVELHGGSTWTADLQFTDYLMYRPNYKATASGHPGIWVALRHLSWTFKASASFDAKTRQWKLGKVTSPNAPTITSTASPAEPEFASIVTPPATCP